MGLVKGRIAFISNRASKADSRQGNTVHVVTVVVYLEFLTAAAAGCVNVARVVIIVLQHGLDRDALATRVNFNPFRAPLQSTHSRHLLPLQGIQIQSPPKRLRRSGAGRHQVSVQLGR